MSPDLILPGLLLLGLVTVIALVWLAMREQNTQLPSNSFYGRDRSQQRYRKAWRVDRNTRHTMIGVALTVAVVVVPYLVDPSAAIAIVAMITLAVVVWEISETNKPAQGSKSVPPPLPPARPPQPTASPGTYSKVYKQSRKITQSAPSAQPVNEPQDHEVMRRLYAMVNGDRQLAERLIQQVRMRNPGRSDAWCYEKVVYDLERDRLRG